MIFAVFDPSPLTLCINCSFLHLYYIEGMDCCWITLYRVEGCQKFDNFALSDMWMSPCAFQ